MRIVWAIIALLVLVTAGLVVLSRPAKPVQPVLESGQPASTSASDAARPAPGPDHETGAQPAESVPPVPASAPNATPSPTTQHAPETDGAATDPGPSTIEAQPQESHTATATNPAPPQSPEAEPGTRESEPPATRQTASAPAQQSSQPPSSAPENAALPAPAVPAANPPPAPAEPVTNPASTATPPVAPESGENPAPVESGADPTSPPAGAVTHNAPAPPPVVPDQVSTRSAMGLLSNIMNQSQIAPGADFIGRLASAASGFWTPAPEAQAAVPGSARAFRIVSPTGGADTFVTDDGKGNNVTIILPRPDVDLVHTLLEQSAQLALAPEDPAQPAPPGVETFGVSLGGEPAGILTISPVAAGPGAGGLAINFVGTTPVPASALAPAGAANDIAYEVQDDGSIKLANGMVIQGNGTPEKPYALTWELLVSAERVYQPRNGLTSMPSWCEALHDKHVRITGHLLSPLMMDDTTQILLMRNQWDGCCVGVPPTPYDAIEVELSRPVSLVREQLNYGTLSGVFVVDPYLVNNWLVGLWMLDEAQIEASGAQNWAVPSAPN